MSLVLYPLSSFRAASKAALNAYEAIMRDGTQAAVVDSMQTRAELYEHLNYHAFDQKLDKLFQNDLPLSDGLSTNPHRPSEK